jgi:two-component system KDP operon response regulator KdpE
MSTNTPIVLVVEDDLHIRRFVHAALEAEGCRVVDSDTMAQGLIEAGTRKPDMVILDLGLPDGNGLQFVQDLRTWSSMPVLVLSARTAETDKIEVLDAGADDYLTKPFSVGELLARVRALLRRARKGTDIEQPVFSFGDIEVDLVRRQVTRSGAAVHLTPIEYRLLCVLLANAGKVMTHRHLLRDVWGPSYVESNHYLRIYVGHLRHKLEDDPAQPRYFLTETGVGYRFHANL